MNTQWFTRNVASAPAVLRTLEAACFAAAALIPVVSFHKCAELEMSESQLLVGVLATLMTALFYTVLGVLIEFKTRTIVR